MNIPYALQRPWLLARGARTDRRRPDLDGLRRIEDPTRFVWAILPHAARSFATSIVLLPTDKALTTAVAYLYCRILDTYEDLSAPDDASPALEAFAARMRTMLPPPPPPPGIADDRDRAAVLLIERCDLVDRVFAGLPVDHQSRIIELVEAMAAGMASSSRRFRDQGGVLIDREQLSEYCHHVIGQPVLFTLLLVGESHLTPAQRRDALASSELIQLANITRDIEHDLARGIGYHPDLRPHLGAATADAPVRTARRRFLAHALPHVSAYNRLADQLATGRVSLARASAVMMLLQTDRHYRRTARQAGLDAWRGPDRTMALMATSALAAVSRRWARRVMQRVERDFLTMAVVAGSAAGQSTNG